MIDSLLDTDLYKFTMMQVVLHHFPAAQVEYRFRCRTPGIDLRGCVEQIRAEIAALCALRFSEAELAYLAQLRFIKSDFVDFLALFQMNQKYISVAASEQVQGEIEVQIRGPWLHTILFEVPVLAIINETYFRRLSPATDYGVARARLAEKIAMISGPADLRDCKVADYGTRRRFSRVWHEELVAVLKQRLGRQFAGTSNVDLARRYALVPLGTMAHEYLQACQALGPRLRDSQTFAFEVWCKEYRGDLGIALSDVYGFDAFLRDFDLYFCKLFDGVRHDSGDPFAWGERMIQHYAALRIDARTKTLIFSDGLDFPRVIALYRRFHERARLAFGVGTNLTNDVGLPSLQTVIKMVRCNGQPVAKLSDTPAKNMCDDRAYVAYLREVFEIATPAAPTEAPSSHGN